MDVIWVGLFLIVAFLAGAGWQKRKLARERYALSEAPKLPSQTTHPSAPPETDGETIPIGERLFTVVFLAGWLIAWSSGILMVVATLLGGESEASLFLLGWLIAAVAGWFAAVHALISALWGRRSALFRRRR